MSTAPRPAPVQAQDSKIATLLWVVNPAVLIGLALFGLFGLTP